MQQRTVWGPTDGVIERIEGAMDAIRDGLHNHAESVLAKMVQELRQLPGGSQLVAKDCDRGG